MTSLSRRSFLKMLGFGAAALAARPLIFDYGANLYKLPAPAVISMPLGGLNTADIVAYLDRLDAQIQAQIALPDRIFVSSAVFDALYGGRGSAEMLIEQRGNRLLVAHTPKLGTVGGIKRSDWRRGIAA